MARRFVQFNLDEIKSVEFHPHGVSAAIGNKKYWLDADFLLSAFAFAGGVDCVGRVEDERLILYHQDLDGSFRRA